MADNGVKKILSPFAWHSAPDKQVTYENESMKRTGDTKAAINPLSCVADWLLLACLHSQINTSNIRTAKEYVAKASQLCSSAKRNGLQLTCPLVVKATELHVREKAGDSAADLEAEWRKLEDDWKSSDRDTKAGVLIIKGLQLMRCGLSQYPAATAAFKEAEKLDDELEGLSDANRFWVKFSLADLSSRKRRSDDFGKSVMQNWEKYQWDAAWELVQKHEDDCAPTDLLAFRASFAEAVMHRDKERSLVEAETIIRILNEQKLVAQISKDFEYHLLHKCWKISRAHSDEGVTKELEERILALADAVDNPQCFYLCAMIHRARNELEVSLQFLEKASEPRHLVAEMMKLRTEADLRSRPLSHVQEEFDNLAAKYNGQRADVAMIKLRQAELLLKFGSGSEEQVQVQAAWKQIYDVLAGYPSVVRRLPLYDWHSIIKEFKKKGHCLQQEQLQWCQVAMLPHCPGKEQNRQQKQQLQRQKQQQQKQQQAKEENEIQNNPSRRPRRRKRKQQQKAGEERKQQRQQQEEQEQQDQQQQQQQQQQQEQQQQQQQQPQQKQKQQQQEEQQQQQTTDESKSTNKPSKRPRRRKKKQQQQQQKAVQEGEQQQQQQQQQKTEEQNMPKEPSKRSRRRKSQQQPKEAASEDQQQQQQEQQEHNQHQERMGQKWQQLLMLECVGWKLMKEGEFNESNGNFERLGDDYRTKRQLAQQEQQEKQQQEGQKEQQQLLIECKGWQLMKEGKFEHKLKDKQTKSSKKRRVRKTKKQQQQQKEEQEQQQEGQQEQLEQQQQLVIECEGWKLMKEGKFEEAKTCFECLNDCRTKRQLLARTRCLQTFPWKQTLQQLWYCANLGCKDVYLPLLNELINTKEEQMKQISNRYSKEAAKAEAEAPWLLFTQAAYSLCTRMMDENDGSQFLLDCRNDRVDYYRQVRLMCRRFLGCPDDEADQKWKLMRETRLQLTSVAGSQEMKLKLRKLLKDLKDSLDVSLKLLPGAKANIYFPHAFHSQKFSKEFGSKENPQKQVASVKEAVESKETAELQKLVEDCLKDTCKTKANMPNFHNDKRTRDIFTFLCCRELQLWRQGVWHLLWIHEANRTAHEDGDAGGGWEELLEMMHRAAEFAEETRWVFQRQQQEQQEQQQQKKQQQQQEQENQELEQHEKQHQQQEEQQQHQEGTAVAAAAAEAACRFVSAEIAGTSATWR